MLPVCVTVLGSTRRLLEGRSTKRRGGGGGGAETTAFVLIMLGFMTLGVWHDRNSGRAGGGGGDFGGCLIRESSKVI